MEPSPCTPPHREPSKDIKNVIWSIIPTKQNKTKQTTFFHRLMSNITPMTYHKYNVTSLKFEKTFKHKEPWRTLIKLMFLKQTMHSPWRLVEMSKACWMTIKEPWSTLRRLIFLNQIMHPLWGFVEILKGCWKLIKEL